MKKKYLLWFLFLGLSLNLYSQEKVKIIGSFELAKNSSLDSAILKIDSSKFVIRNLSQYFVHGSNQVDTVITIQDDGDIIFVGGKIAMKNDSTETKMLLESNGELTIQGGEIRFVNDSIPNQDTTLMINENLIRIVGGSFIVGELPNDTAVHISEQGLGLKDAGLTVVSSFVADGPIPNDTVVFISEQGIGLTNVPFIVTGLVNDTIVQIDSSGLCIQGGGFEIIDQGTSFLEVKSEFSTDTSAIILTNGLDDFVSSKMIIQNKGYDGLEVASVFFTDTTNNLLTISPSGRIGIGTDFARGPLDIIDTLNGIFLPALSQAQIDLNPFPQQGELLFNQDSAYYQYYDGIEWCIIDKNTNTSSIQDADNTTSIHTELTPNSEKIHITTNGKQRWFFDEFRLNGTDALKGSVIIGQNAGQSQMDNSSFRYNTFIGKDAGKSIVSGMHNLAIGANAFQNASGGHNNFAFGNQALLNNSTGIFNVGLGKNTLHANESGSGNVALGNYSQTSNPDGSYNISIGHASGFESGSNNICIGTEAGYGSSGNNKLFIDNTSTLYPLIYGEFDNNILAVNGILGIGTKTPDYALHAVNEGTTGNRTIVAKLESRISRRPTLFFSESDADFGMSIEYNGASTSDNSMVINDTSGLPVISFKSSGNVGVGTTNPTALFEVDGGMKIDGNTFNIDEVNNRVGIGTSTPGKTLQVVGGAQIDLLTFFVDDVADRVGIGTSTPSSKLEVIGGAKIDYNTFNVDASQDRVGIGTSSPSETLEIVGSVKADGSTFNLDDVNNRIGIGTSTPEARLHVNGDAYVDNDLYLGSTYNSASLELRESESGATRHGYIRLRNYNFTDTDKTAIIIDTDGSANEPYITLKHSDGTNAIVLDADVSGNSRITTDEVEIKGGSDFAENFDIVESDLEPKPGMVVSIDPNNSGKLIISAQTFDKKIAGIVSGANGIQTGLKMSQKGSIADGQYPIALSGRVYVKSCSEGGMIMPGDLLTSSSLPGLAMRVNVDNPPIGTILGKAMTSPDENDFVLVLVNLQ